MTFFIIGFISGFAASAIIVWLYGVKHLKDRGCVKWTQKQEGAYKPTLVTTKLTQSG